MNFGEWIIAMVVFMFWIMAIMIWFSVLMDIFRRNDLSGAMKALWLLVCFWIPLFGCLIYMIVRPKVTAQDVQMMTQAEAAAGAAAKVSTADELAKLAQLRDNGAITIPEYEALKAKLLA